jgi:hypothetical protein
LGETRGAIVTCSTLGLIGDFAGLAQLALCLEASFIAVCTGNTRKTGKMALVVLESAEVAIDTGTLSPLALEAPLTAYTA